MEEMREGTFHSLEASAGLSLISKAQYQVRWACRDGASSPHIQDLRVKGLDLFQLGEPQGPQTRPHSPLGPARPPEVAIYAACTQRGAVF